MRRVNSIYHEIRHALRCLHVKDYRRLMYLILKDLAYILNSRERYAKFRDKFYNAITIAEPWPGIKLFNRRYDSLGEIFLDKEYIRFKDFLPSEGDVVIDVGANIGEYTLIAAKLVGARGEVIAIEPHPESYSLLRKNIEINRLDNVVALQVALSDKDHQEIKLIEPEVMGVRYPVWASIMNTEKVGRYFFVKTVTLDTLVNKLRLKRVNLLKIDVEGAEVLVLRGAVNTLKRLKPKICIETHGSQNRKSVLNMLKRYNYKLINRRRRIVHGEIYEYLYLAP